MAESNIETQNSTAQAPDGQQQNNQTTFHELPPHLAPQITELKNTVTTKGKHYLTLFYALGSAVIVGNALIGALELIFGGDAGYALCLGLTTIGINLISPLFVFIGCVPTYKTCIKTKSALNTLELSYQYGFGCFDKVSYPIEANKVLGAKYTKIKEEYEEADTKIIDESSKIINNGRKN